MWIHSQLETCRKPSFNTQQVTNHDRFMPLPKLTSYESDDEQWIDDYIIESETTSALGRDY